MPATPELQILRPATAYPRRPPNLFDVRAGNLGFMAAFYEIVSQRQTACPAQGVHHFPRCFLYEGAFILGPDAEWVPETVVDWGIAPQILPGLRDAVAAGRVAALPRTDRPIVVFAKAGFSNYGHVMADMLPRLMNLPATGWRSIRLVLPEPMTRYADLVVRICAHLGIAAELEILRPGELVDAREVYYLSAVSRHDLVKSPTFLELRDVLFTLFGVRHAPGRRLYVRRGDTDHRRITNAAAAEQVFAEHGYAVVQPATLPVEDQLHLFASASHVAGPLGAGLANIAFAPAGAAVAMIDPGLGDFYFWDFACLCSLRFSWLFAGPLQGWNPALSMDDYAVDIPALRSAAALLHA